MLRAMPADRRSVRGRYGLVEATDVPCPDRATSGSYTIYAKRSGSSESRIHVDGGERAQSTGPMLRARPPPSSAASPSRTTAHDPLADESARDVWRRKIGSSSRRHLVPIDRRGARRGQ